MQLFPENPNLTFSGKGEEGPSGPIGSNNRKNMKATVIKPQVVYLEFATKKELTMTMCRPQEFYESAHDHIRSNYFSMETFLETFTDDEGNFGYFSDWSGFNIPSTSFNNFFVQFGDLTNRERNLLKTVRENVDSTKPFYVIATQAGAIDTIKHEVAHALFHVDECYHDYAVQYLEKLDPGVSKLMCDVMFKMGYSPTVFVDELNAYLSTSDDEYLRTRFAGIDLDAARPTIHALTTLFSIHAPQIVH